MTKPCTHRRCPYDRCHALTPEELEPSADDTALGEQLVAEGWISTSTKYRHLIRWRLLPPKFEDLIRPEQMGSYFIEQVREAYNARIGREWALRMAPDALVERRTLTLRQFRAFKRAQRAAEERLNDDSSHAWAAERAQHQEAEARDLAHKQAGLEAVDGPAIRVVRVVHASAPEEL
ncbi:MAG: hypothetical protein ACTHU0_02695 [Kofleriaceae bacterium]